MMSGSLKDRVRDAAIATAVMHPIATLVSIVVGIIVVLFVAFAFLSVLAKYIVALAVLVAVYYLVTSGTLSAAVSELRSRPRDAVFAGLLIMVLGISIPFVLQPVPYVSLAVSTSFRITGSPGIFGFFAKTIDMNTFTASASFLSAYYGAPYIHYPSSPTSYSHDPKDGWWICAQVSSSPRVCWNVPAVDVLSSLTQGDQRQYTFVVNEYPLSSTRGVVTLTLYNNGAPVWQRNVPYVLTSSPAAVISVPGSETNAPSASP